MAEAPPRVLIAEPIYHSLRPEVYANRMVFRNTVWSRSRDGIYKTASLVIPHENIRTARQKAITDALRMEATHILFIDDDVILPEDILALLLEAKVDIIGGLMNREDGKPIVFKDAGSVTVQELSFSRGEEVWEDHPTDRVFECAAIGAGCMLIATSVFHMIRMMFNPVFYFNYDDSLRTMDVRFCQMARLAGHHVYCLPSPRCEQLKRG